METKLSSVMPNAKPVKIGIIPAGGNAIRFGGIYKELLPLPDGRAMIEHAIERVSFCDRVVIVTNKDKCRLHRRYADKNITVIEQSLPEMWGAIATAQYAYDADQYYMTMPDTWMELDAFWGVPETDFAYGYFLTHQPGRYGVYIDGKFVDKPTTATVPAMAWGVLTWSRRIKELWQAENVKDYTQAINTALKNTRNGHWSIGSYFDCADMDRYMELLDYLRKDSNE
jgi:hypothetical protein